jgi:hypothetical protein
MMTSNKTCVATHKVTVFNLYDVTASQLSEKGGDRSPPLAVSFCGLNRCLYALPRLAD